MSDICQIQHHIVLRVTKLLGADYSAARADVHVYAASTDGRQKRVHTEHLMGKVRAPCYYRRVAVWVGTDFGPVAAFALKCEAEPGSEVEVVLA
ncbi:hypothetical protein ACFY89_29170 [Achromobacter spanius]|uniref:hypothetical protein n=1 Tax=Achromobacter spanius TaxID=217203 RepID=UPI0036EBE0A5